MSKHTSVEEVVENASERADYFKPDAKVVPVRSVHFLLTTHTDTILAELREAVAERSDGSPDTTSLHITDILTLIDSFSSKEK